MAASVIASTIKVAGSQDHAPNGAEPTTELPLTEPMAQEEAAQEVGVDGDEDVDGDGISDDDMEDVGDEIEEDTGSEGSSEAASDEDPGSEGDEHEAVGAVKLPEGVDLNSEEDEASDDASETSEDSQGSHIVVLPPHYTDAESESSSSAVEEWEDASAGEGDGETAVRNNCLFCKLSEEEDPSEDFEEYLTCSVCGNNAHQQCAREDDFLADGENIKAWQCPECVERDGGSTVAEDSKHRRQSTASQVPKDLLPAPRGGVKPGSHSIFTDLIIDEDPLDGSRPLRKRKASSEAIESTSRSSSKKRRTSQGSQPTSEAVGSRPQSSHKQRSQRSSVNKKEILPAQDGPAKDSSPSKPDRSRRQKPVVSRVRVVEKDAKKKFVVALKVDLSQVRKARMLKKYKRSVAMPPSQFRISHLPATQYGSPCYSLQNNDLDETKNKPYGGILTEAQADTSKTFPELDDRARFDDARRRYEDEWKIKTATLEAEMELKNRASTKISGPPSKIKCINFGGFEIDTWYAAPYPEEYSRNRVLFICEFCLKYMPSDYVAWRHKLKCPTKHPPGDEIYRDTSISVFEVDGRKNPVYCQNLCLLAKLFLGSKTLYYDVEPFLFYIMTEYDDFGYHFVGYFSKEKRPSSMNNVSCILTLPIHQRKGYGNLLIDFSYLLTRVEQKTGSPEKPLSDMGLVSYRNYWRLVLARALLEQREPVSITSISDQTGMTPDDIVAGLEALRALVRDPVTKTYALRIDRGFLKETIEGWEAKKYVTLNPDALIWTPYIMGRNNLASYDRGAPISTVAPREDEDEPGTNAAQPEEGVQVEMQQAAEEANAKPKDSIQVNGSSESATAALTEHHIGLDGKELPSAENASSPKLNGVHSFDSIDQTEAAQNNSPEPVAPPIPPARYEIYPPIPGTTVRRKYYRPPPRKSVGSPATLTVRRGRPANSAASAATTPAKADEPKVNGVGPNGGLASGAQTPSGRKTRSKATEEQLLIPDAIEVSLDADEGDNAINSNVEDEAVATASEDQEQVGEDEVDASEQA